MLVTEVDDYCNQMIDGLFESACGLHKVSLRSIVSERNTYYLTYNIAGIIDGSLVELIVDGNNHQEVNIFYRSERLFDYSFRNYQKISYFWYLQR